MLPTTRAIPRFSRDNRFRRGKSASSPNARQNSEIDPRALFALLRIISCAVTPVVASPSVRKMIIGTCCDDEGEDEEGLTSWAAERIAALMFVPGKKKQREKLVSVKDTAECNGRTVQGVMKTPTALGNDFPDKLLCIPYVLLCGLYCAAFLPGMHLIRKCDDVEVVSLTEVTQDGEHGCLGLGQNTSIGDLRSSLM